MRAIPVGEATELTDEQAAALIAEMFMQNARAHRSPISTVKPDPSRTVGQRPAYAASQRAPKGATA